VLPLPAYDKVLHFCYGATIGSTLSVIQVLAIALLRDAVPMIDCTHVHWAPVVSLVVVVAIAIGWEIRQKATGGAASPLEMTLDALATSLGGLASVATTLVIYAI